jgi:glutamate---cysteine ligase / carboxylate-amine ligase
MGDFTVGIEEEYQLIDMHTADLRSSGRAVRGCDWSGDIRKELQESTIEIGTAVSATSGGALSELRRLRAQAATAAAVEDLAIAAAGLHPFSEWRDHEMTAGARYARMAEVYGRIARDEHNFGMHIHVAPGAGADRIEVMNAVSRYVPHLLALSCSSPYFEGEDTGYASYRMVLWRRWPGAGVPPRLTSEAEYREYMDMQLRTGVLQDERSVYWMIRPHPEYPTLEFRMCDVCPNMEDAAAIAGLTRTLVAAAVEGALPAPSAGRLSGAAWDALLSDDCWRVTRYGLGARLMGTGGAAGERASDAIEALLDHVQRVAEAIGETEALGGVSRILRRGNGAARMREAYGDTGDLKLLMQWLAAETLVGAGMDRRSTQRECARSNQR